MSTTPQKLEDATQAYFDAAQLSGGLSEKSVRAYAYDLGQFAAFISGKKLKDITAKDIRNYIKQMEIDGGLKPQTIRRKLMALKAFFRHCQDQGWIAQAPTDGVEPAKLGGAEPPRVFKPAEIRKLLECAAAFVEETQSQVTAAGGHRARLRYENALRDRAIISILFGTGVRIGELVDLNLDDLDLRRRKIHVDGKGAANRQLGYGADELVGAVQDYMKIRRPSKSKSAALFLNRFGDRLSIFAVENLFQAIYRRCGLRRRATPNILRHTLAVMLLQYGRSSGDLQTILGHNSTVTTQLYTKLVSRRQSKAYADMASEGWFDLTGVAESSANGATAPAVGRKAAKPKK
ncbi:MAG: tyrosine-type recombinase/integrase [Deltaproteobacteria bacterium]|nr:tyrosine-type recombinase/integrase [Deltaproteobacteria bacterium]